eukprot:1665141-Prymnesium_polylepis.1
MARPCTPRQRSNPKHAHAGSLLGRRAAGDAARGSAQGHALSLLLRRGAAVTRSRGRGARAPP